MPDDTGAPRRRSIIKHQEMSSRHKRVFGQDPMTGSVRSRSSAVVDSDDEVVQDDAVTIAAGAEHLFEIIVATQSQEHLQATIEQSLYVGSVAAANVLPGGSAVTESDWQVIGPIPSLLKADGDETEPYERCFQTYVRNASAGPLDVILRYRISYIANRGNALA
jgi:hypothetical protein